MTTIDIQKTDPTCPVWCAGDHNPEQVHLRLVEEWHSSVFGRGPISVRLTWDDEGDEEPPMVQVDIDELMRPEDAERLARALLAAAALTRTGATR